MNIYEIAAEAGVSISTVSRVLNTPDKVSARTRDKVEAVLKKNNYTPNAIARGLVTNSTRTVAILLSDIRNRHFSEAAFTLEKCFFDMGYSTVFCNTGYDDAKKAEYIRIMSSRHVDGMVMLGSIFESDAVRKAIEHSMPHTPIVLSNGFIDIDNAYSVCVDHDYGLKQAVDYLHETNRGSIAFIYTTNTTNSIRKAEAFEKAVRPYEPSALRSSIYALTHPSYDNGEFADRIAELAGDFDALIFSEDYYALLGINILKRRGLSVPDDVAVIGFDNSVFSRCSFPQITTIDTKITSMSEIVADTLHSLFEGKTTGKTIMIHPNLIVREST